MHDENPALHYLTAAWKGAAAGCLATIPMTLALLVLHRLLPEWPRPTLPPKKVAMGLASRVGLKKHLDKPEQSTMAWVTHFAFGTGAGAVYGPLGRNLPIPRVASGTAFGLLVWAVSYLGWLPAMDLPGAAPDESAHRNLMMIAAHLVWGSALGAAVQLLDLPASGQGRMDEAA
jgi:uncharacterized membrane protein YagU involved in acid resistance